MAGQCSPSRPPTAATPVYSGPQPAAAPRTPSRSCPTPFSARGRLAPEPFVRRRSPRVGDADNGRTGGRVPRARALARSRSRSRASPTITPTCSRRPALPDRRRDARAVVDGVGADRAARSVEPHVAHRPREPTSWSTTSPSPIPPTGSGGARQRPPSFVGFDSPTVVDAAPDTVDRPWTPEDSAADRRRTPRRDLHRLGVDDRRAGPRRADVGDPRLGARDLRRVERARHGVRTVRHGRPTTPTMRPTSGEPATRLRQHRSTDEVATDDVMGAEDTGADFVGAELLPNSRAPNSRDELARLTRRSR